MGTYPNGNAYIARLQGDGVYHFTTEEALLALGGSAPAVRAVLRRMKDKGHLASPHRGFYIVVPPEYRRLGCLPPEQFVPQLMEHLGEPYYVSLLSAAERLGAAHQRPQIFQVMVGTARRSIACGRVQVGFVVRRDMGHTSTVEQNTPRGRLNVASPEATCCEMVGYVEHCGGLDNIATVLAELAENLRVRHLKKEADRCPIAWVQRLGYLLELAGAGAKTGPLSRLVRDRAPQVTALEPALSIKGAPRNARWRLAVNTEVEPEA
jgi:predicted transcriptional regulator of viral defense system